MEKTIKKMSAVLTMIALAILSFTFTACGDDNDEPIDESAKAVAYRFNLRLADVNPDSDQADLITTTYSYVNPQGEKVEEEFTDQFLENVTVKSQNYTTLPGEVEITVTETLNSDVELTKEKYNVGLKMDLAVSSLTKNDAVIDMASTSFGSGLTVPAANLSKLYPKTHRFKIAVDKDGKVTIK